MLNLGQRIPQLGMPCFGETTWIFLHAIFLCVFLLQCLWKGTKIGYHRLITTERDDRKKNVSQTMSQLDVNLDNAYKGTLACCSSLFLVHLSIVIWILFVGENDSYHCNSRTYLTSAEVSQALSSFIAFVIVINFWRVSSTMIPRILQAWWICSLFQSIFCFVLCINNVLRHHTMGIIEYVNFGNPIIHMYLFLVAVRGKTGIITSSSGGLTTPLLHEEQESPGEVNMKTRLYGNTNIIQRITFSWLNPLLSVGIQKTLDKEDVPDLHRHDSAEFVSRAFDQCFASEKGTTCGPSFYKAVYLFIRKKAVINALFALITASASFVGPYLINDCVKFLTRKKESDRQTGYLLALVLFSAKVLETVSQRQCIFGSRQLGLRLRAALISQIYKKGLRLSSQSRQSHTSGEMINYMGVDIQRITEFVWYLNIICMLPIQISLAIYILCTNLGLGSLAGLAATVTIMACNIPLTKLHKRIQSKVMEAKDDRMKTTAEALRNIKTLKLQAWDIHYLHTLEELRKKEYKFLLRSAWLSAYSKFISWSSPALISLVTFGTCVLIGIKLTAGSVLSALATFRMLQDPINTLPDLVSVLTQAKVSFERLESYLQEDELKHDAVQVIRKDVSEGLAVDITDGEFTWQPGTKHITLCGISLQVKQGTRVAICGTVGAGKSSLLSSILGEITKLSGIVKVKGTKAYVPQSPWILTGNVRDNILFGGAYDHSKYNRTIKACALAKDLELFPEGDLTEIGERGINISGGQKQRIQIARAIYQDADIYLLDDPFSAVDAYTGTHLFEECLMGLLKEKTVLYVTHQVEFLPAADLIVVMHEGKITQVGKFEELLQRNRGFELLVGAHNQAIQAISSVERSSRLAQTPLKRLTETNREGQLEPKSRSKIALHNGSSNNLKPEICQESTLKVRKSQQDEEREKGSIGKEVYLTYLTAVWHGGLVPMIILAQTAFQTLHVASNYWMAWASPLTDSAEKHVSTSALFQVYILLSLGSSLCVLIRAVLVEITGLLTAQKLFEKMLRSVLHAPMSFFDSTPTGRILNRASTDQSLVDFEIPNKLGSCAFSVIQILATITVMSQVSWPVFAIFIPVTAICIWCQQYYTPTARELSRLAGAQRAPILHHFAESLAGAATIRAFNQEGRFVTTNLDLTDAHSRPFFHNVSALEWLNFRLNFISNVVFVFSLIILVSLPEGAINPRIAGLAVTYALNLNQQQASVIWNISSAQNKMISVERILQYSKITSEAPFIVDECRLPSNWPSMGMISLKDLEVRYAEHLPSVLRNITCTFPGRNKIGVVGRTGSGKSTLIQALFRIVEPRNGTIVIDGVDVMSLGLQDLRSRLSIIPQDPTMFEGTLRSNLDPLQQFTDLLIWEALEKCQLGETVRAKESRLESPVAENGENWSVGQRQLVCLGRAMLKRSTILVLDEATASIDTATDGIIQQIIRQEFTDCTVITIAHRIHTVIDSDLILVLSEGTIEEYDTPANLLERKDSAFSKLIAEYSMRSNGILNFGNL